MRVSSPRSMSYGQYWTREEVNEFLAAPRPQRALVMGWLRSEGVEDIELIANRFVQTRMSVELAESLLHVSFHLLHHRATGVQHLRALEDYQLPEHIASHLWIVTGVNRLPSK